MALASWRAVLAILVLLLAGCDEKFSRTFANDERTHEFTGRPPWVTAEWRDRDAGITCWTSHLGFASAAVTCFRDAAAARAAGGSP